MLYEGTTEAESSSWRHSLTTFLTVSIVRAVDPERRHPKEYARIIQEYARELMQNNDDDQQYYHNVLFQWMARSEKVESLDQSLCREMSLRSQRWWWLLVLWSVVVVVVVVVVIYFQKKEKSVVVTTFTPATPLRIITSKSSRRRQRSLSSSPLTKPAAAAAAALVVVTSARKKKKKKRRSVRSKTPRTAPIRRRRSGETARVEKMEGFMLFSDGQKCEF